MTRQHRFKAEIYKTGINYCVDVPKRITSEMTATKGYIKVKGTINTFPFNKSLVPVKNGPYRLFVNIQMLKGSNTVVGKTADFKIEQDFNVQKKQYAIPKMLTEQLMRNKLYEDFNSLSESKRNLILKYLSFIKTEKTLERNISKLINQLRNKEKNPRIP